MDPLKKPVPSGLGRPVKQQGLTHACWLESARQLDQPRTWWNRVKQKNSTCRYRVDCQRARQGLSCPGGGLYGCPLSCTLSCTRMHKIRLSSSSLWPLSILKRVFLFLRTSGVASASLFFAGAAWYVPGGALFSQLNSGVKDAMVVSTK